MTNAKPDPVRALAVMSGHLAFMAAMRYAQPMNSNIAFAPYYPRAVAAD